MIAVSEEMKNEDLNGSVQYGHRKLLRRLLSKRNTAEAELQKKKTTEKAPEKEGFFKKKKDPKR